MAPGTGAPAVAAVLFLGLLILMLIALITSAALFAVDATDLPTWAVPVINLGGFGIVGYYMMFVIPRQRTEDQVDRAKRYEMWQAERKEILDAHAAERVQLLATCREEVGKERQHAGELTAAERTMWADKYDRLASRLEENGRAITEKTLVLAQLGDSLKETNLALKADMVATQTVAQATLTILGEIKTNQLAAAEKGGRRKADGQAAGTSQ